MNIAVWIVLGILALCLGWYISTMNRFARMAVKVQEADSGIDVALTKRYDTLTKMLEVTKAYARHEAETLAKVIQMRSGMDMKERSELNRQMDGVADKIKLLVEAYPELRSSENFQALQNSINEVEDHLQASRRIYNMNVSSFNQLLASWPASIVGNMNKHSPKDFFEADEQKRQDVRMDF